MDKMSNCREKAVSYSHFRITYKSFYSLLVYFQILFVVFYRLLLQYGVPSGVSYLTDVINGVLLLGMIKSSKPIGKIKNLVLLYCLLFCWGVFGAIIYDFSMPLLLWSARNNLRFIVFAVACVYYLKIQDFKFMLDFFQKLMPVETILVIIQYFVFQYNGDYLGGIFGTVMGANLYVNLFVVIVFSYTLVNFLNGNNSFKKLLFITIEIIVVAVLSELKFVFVELIIIAGIAVFFVKKDAKRIGKTILVIASGYIVMSIALPYLYKLYPDFENFLTLDFIFAVHEQGYSMAGDLDRLSAIPIITEKIFNNNIVEMLFGIGFGNAEYSSIDVFCSDFYRIYGYLHYTWFSDAMIYLESGFVGLALYALTFVAVFLEAMRNLNVRKNYFGIYGTVMIICVMSLVLVIYNQTLRTEAAYLLYFVIAAAFVPVNEEQTVVKRV